MTTTRTALLALLLTVVPVCAADVTGNWKLNINLNGVPELLCTVTQKEQRLKGACNAGDEAGVALNDGRVSGDQVSWSWKVTTPDANTWTYAVHRHAGRKRQNHQGCHQVLRRLRLQAE